MSVGKKTDVRWVGFHPLPGDTLQLITNNCKFGRKSFITVEPGVLRILDYSEKDFLGMVDQLI